MGSDETASAIPESPRLILLIAGQRRVLERARQLNPVNPWPRGLSEVALGWYSTWAGGYTHAPGLPSVETYQYRCSARHRARAKVPQVFDLELSGEPQEPAHAAQATTRPQTYPRGTPGAELHPKKVNNLGPMAPRPRSKRQLPEGPQ